MHRIPEIRRRERLHAPGLRWRKSFARSVRWAARTFPIVAVLAAVAPQASVASPALHEVAETAVRPAGAPDYADVAFRYGWVRTSAFPTVQDAKDAIRDFHATRVDWFYPGSHSADSGAVYVTAEGQNFIDWCHDNGMKIVGTISTLTTTAAWDSGAPTNGGRYRGDPNNAAYVAEAVKWGTDQVDAGVDAIVVDDFFGYTDDSDRQAFNDNVVLPIKAYSETNGYPGGIEIAANKGTSLGTDYVVPYAYDFHYSDTTFTADPSQMWEASKAHRAQNSAFLQHPNRTMTTDERRTLIGLGYATGSHIITPWDEFISSVEGGGRLFEDPADFADLYGFARALGQLGYLNGHEDAAVGGYDLTETRFGAAPPISVTGGSGSLSVFARAQPGQPDAAVVFHLVESGTPQAATLRLRIPPLFGTSNVVCTLLTPPAYNETAHDAAATSGDYSALASASTLSSSVDGLDLVIDVPAATPWGLLVIEPAADSHALQVSPASATVPADGTQAFTATVVDSSGTPLSPQPTVAWSIDAGGTIDATGLFTAGPFAAVGTVTASAVLDGGETVIASQTVTVEGSVIPSTVAYWNASTGGSTLVDLVGADQTLSGGTNVLSPSSLNVAPFPVPNPDPATNGGDGSILFTSDTDAAPGLTSGASVFQMTNSASFTFEGWIQADSGATGYIASDRHQGNSYRGWFLELQASGAIQFYSNSGGTVTTVNSAVVTDGSPHHFAAVWNHATGQMSLYLDGVLQGSAQSHAVGSYTAYGFSIGGRDGTSSGSAFIDNKLSPDTRLDELRFSDVVLAPAGFLFADVVDETPPSIASLSPEDDSTNAPVDGNLVVTFNEMITLKSGGILTITDTDDGSGTQVITLPDAARASVSGNILTIDPLSDLEFGTNYEVTIDGAAIEDRAETPNAFPGTSPGQWTFTAQSQASPTIAYWQSATGGTTVTDLAGGDHTLSAASGLGASATTVAPDPVPNPDPAATGAAGSIQVSTASLAPKITDGSDFNLNDSGSFTFEGWFQHEISDGTQSGIEVIGGDRQGGTSPATFKGWYLNMTDGIVQFTYFDPGGIEGNVLSGSRCDDGNAHHFAAVWDHTTRTMTLYLNGVSQGTSTLSSAPTAYTSPGFGLGGRAATSANNDFDDNLFQGNLDELRFSAAALAPAQFLNASGPGPVASFDISPIGSPQTVGTPITGITITAKDASNNTATGFSGTVDFGGSGGFSGSSASFTAGELTGVSVTPTMAGSNLTFTVTDSSGLSTGSTTIASIQSKYEAWASSAAFNDDANGDGISNGLAFLLGAPNAAADARGLLPTVNANSERALVLTFTMRSAASRGAAALKVEHSSDLGLADLWSAVTVPDLSGTTEGVSFTVTPGGSTNSVTAIIDSSLATDGKLFGRLRASE